MYWERCLSQINDVLFISNLKFATIKEDQSGFGFKVHMAQNFLLVRSKDLELSKWWRMVYLLCCHSNSTLGCQVIHDFDLCKLEDLWRHIVDTKLCKITIVCRVDVLPKLHIVLVIMMSP